MRLHVDVPSLDRASAQIASVVGETNPFLSSVDVDAGSADLNAALADFSRTAATAGHRLRDTGTEFALGLRSTAEIYRRADEALAAAIRQPRS